MKKNVSIICIDRALFSVFSAEAAYHRNQGNFTELLTFFFHTHMVYRGYSLLYKWTHIHIQRNSSIFTQYLFSFQRRVNERIKRKMRKKRRKMWEGSNVEQEGLSFISLIFLALNSRLTNDAEKICCELSWLIETFNFYLLFYCFLLFL